MSVNGDRPRGRRPRRGADPGPRPVAESLDAVSASLGAGPASVMARTFTCWPEVVGTAMAEHVQPVRLSEGVLVVAADHPAWAAQARALGTDLLARMGRITGEAPRRLEVTVRRR